MGNSTIQIDTIASNQANKEVVVNALLDAATPGMIWGRHASACSGLTWGFYGGQYGSNAIANGTVTLTASTTNYVYADNATGAVSVNATGVPSGKIPLYSIVTGTTTVTSYTDLRSYAPQSQAGASFGNQSANYVFAGPTSGAAAAPAFRALVPADYPVFVASGASHAAGAVPDPGATAGTTRYLREDGTWQVPPGSGGSSTLAGLTDVNVTEGSPINNDVLTWNNSTSKWIATARAYDIGVNFQGVTTNGEIFRIKMVRAVTLPASLTGSSFDAGTAATASTVFTLKQNGSSIGTITFAAGSTTGTVSFSSAVTFASGDTLEIDAPATADATLANIAFTFAGTY